MAALKVLASCILLFITRECLQAATGTERDVKHRINLDLTHGSNWSLPNPCQAQQSLRHTFISKTILNVDCLRDPDVLSCLSHGASAAMAVYYLPIPTSLVLLSLLKKLNELTNFGCCCIYSP